MLKSKLKSSLKQIGEIVNANSILRSLEKNARVIDKEVGVLKEIVKRNREMQQALGELVQWINTSKGQLTDLNNEGIELMKFVRNTWMPMAEGHFATVVDPATGNYQAQMYQEALAICKNRRVAIDVGANIGLLAKQMCRDFDLVHCFEPQKVVRSCIHRNVHGNNVTVYPFGLGEKEETVELKSMSVATGGAFIKSASDGVKKVVNEVGSINVEIIRIKPMDDFNFRNVDLIKIDVQGYEIDVLKGAKETLLREKPILIVESGGKIDEISGVDPEEAIRFAVDQLGFAIVKRVNKDVILAIN